MAETFRRAKMDKLVSELQAAIVNTERLIRSGQLTSEQSKTHQEGVKSGLLNALDIVYEVFGIDEEAVPYRRSLPQIKRAYEEIIASDEPAYEKDKRLAALMTVMERDYRIPALKNKEWERNNEPIMDLYLSISNSRETLN